MRIGIDIGGTTVKIGLVDSYKVLEYYSIPTRKETLFADIFESVKDFLKKKNISSIEFIGFGVPGNVKDNYIYMLPNIGIGNIDIEDEISKYFPNIVFASDNDANAAALGEALNDADSSSSYMITLGTGVGGGLVMNGKVIRGSNFACGEIGHMYIDAKHEFSCSCGLKGCLETVASATGVVRLAKRYASSLETKLNLEVATCKDILDAAKENDPLGSYVLDMLASYLARGLANIAVTVDVEVFYIGGGVAACGDILIQKIQRYYQEYAHYAVKNTRIVPAKLGNLAGMLGAAYLI